MALDAEFVKLLRGDLWADGGDRKDFDDASISPVIARNIGWQSSYSTTDTPARTRMNQLFRELYGAAKEVGMGVSAYDAEVPYPINAIVQHQGQLWRATAAHSVDAPIAPAMSGQSLWTLITGDAGITRAIPDQITNNDVLIDGDDGSSFRVYWNAPNENGDTITRYSIRYAKNDSGFTGSNVTTIDDYTQGSLITLTGADAGQSDLFYVQVRATNGQGTPAWNTTPGKQVRTSALSPEPILFFAANPGDGNVVLTWARPFMRGMVLSKYVIEWKSGTQQFTDTGTRHMDVSSATTATITGLTNGTAYDFRIRAVTTRMTFTQGAFTITSTPSAGSASTTPSTPINLSLVPAAGFDSLFASMDNIPDDGGSKILGFDWQMRQSRPSTEVQDTWADPPGTNNATTNVPFNIFTNLPSYELEVRVKARNSNGSSAYSTSAKGRVNFRGLPTKPIITSEGRVTPASGGGTITYVTQPIGDRGADITAIEWRQKLTSQSPADWSIISSTGTPLAIGRTHTIGDSIDFAARAVNSVGKGPWSDTSTIVAPSVGGGVTPAVPDAPSIRVETLPSDAQGRPRVIVHASMPVDANNAAITAFQWQYKTSAAATWSTVDLTGLDATNQFVVIGSGLLTTGTTYQFRAYAVNSIGTSAASNTASATAVSMGTTGAPDALFIGAQNIARSPNAGPRILAFVQNRINDNNSAITAITWQYRLASASTWTTFPGTSTNTSVIIGDGFELHDQREHRIRAYAVNAIGTSAASNEVSITTADPATASQASPPNFIVWRRATSSSTIARAYIGGYPQANGSNITSTIWEVTDYNSQTGVNRGASTTIGTQWTSGTQFGTYDTLGRVNPGLLLVDINKPASPNNVTRIRAAFRNSFGRGAFGGAVHIFWNGDSTGN